MIDSVEQPARSAASDTVDVVRLCRQLAIRVCRGEDAVAIVSMLEEVARRWANHGVPLDRLQQVVHEGFRLGAERAAGLLAPTDGAAATAMMRRQLDALQSLHIGLTRAYTSQLPPPDQRAAAARRMAAVLLRGEPAGIPARHCGIEIAEKYHVVAVAVPAADGDSRAVPRIAAQCVESELAHRLGTNALSFLGAEGGTLLLPMDLIEDERLGDLIAELSQRAGTALVAVVLNAAVDDIPDVARQAHELLETAVQLRATPRLYRFDDVVLPFQLTRPGPGRDALRALLAPLDSRPELLQTLTRHLANDLNRQLTARQLCVHTNTIDYRLKRIGQLTGCDPADLTGLWRLRSALIVRRFTDDDDMLTAAAPRASGSRI
ncbi:PucR family transcriptional regulator [Nocardia sp. N2S4-5]|uniref:PucR family transcriptional regulator n=1 Tax=Nocardia sp. N2S4-5 TaxID=3351565 RepID=UPI0037D432F4